MVILQHHTKFILYLKYIHFLDKKTSPLVEKDCSEEHEKDHSGQENSDEDDWEAEYLESDFEDALDPSDNTHDEEISESVVGAASNRESKHSPSTEETKFTKKENKIWQKYEEPLITAVSKRKPSWNHGLPAEERGPYSRLELWLEVQKEIQGIQVEVIM